MLAHLEFNGHYGRVGNYHAVNSAAQSRYIELKEERPVDARERLLEDPHLLFPRFRLRPINGEAATTGEVPEHGRIVGSEELLDRCRIERRLASIVIGGSHMEKLEARDRTAPGEH